MNRLAGGLTVIGRAERIVLPGHGEAPVPAKVDTGADGSSIWATDIKRNGDRLRFTLFAPESEYYTGRVIELPPEAYRRTRVSSSFGHHQVRYVVKLPVRVLGRTIRASFSLADRSQRTYPVLLGRRLLSGKFLVDVTKGEPLKEDERRKRDALSIALNDLED